MTKNQKQAVTTVQLQIHQVTGRKEMSENGSSRKKAPNPKWTDNCPACGEIGHYIECEDMKSKTKTTKVVHKEVTGLITVKEDPVFSTTRRCDWYLASRCTTHVCNSRDMFVEYEPWSGHEVVLDNNEHADVVGIGTVVLGFSTGKVLTLSNVFHIPTIRNSLVSLYKLDEIGCKIPSEGGALVIKKNHEIMGWGYLENRLYRLSINEEIKSDTKIAKVVHNERISLLIAHAADPELIQKRRRGWYLVSGTSVHVCNSRDMFVEYQPLINHEVPIYMSGLAEVAGIGTVVLRLATGKVLTLTNVLHVPVVIKCLVSVRKLCKMGFCVSLGPEGNFITSMKNDEIVGEAFIDQDGLYRLSIMEERARASNGTLST